MQDTEKYVIAHSSPQEEALEWIERQTHIRTHYPQMLSGVPKTRLLRILVGAIGAKRILEIGTFTGYSSAAMALSLPEGGHIDTYEHNDELEDLIREGWKRAGVSERITLHIGDALDTLPEEGEYDLAYIDADKRLYPSFFVQVLPLIRKGGLIVVDDTLMGGKPSAGATDAQTRGLMAFNDLVVADPRVETVLLPLPDGFTLLRVK